MTEQTKKQMPLSPHLQIYKIQITSLLSITHRMTGFFLYCASVMIIWWLIANIYAIGDVKRIGCHYCHFWHYIVNIVLFGISCCLFYHLYNGIRHLFWDMGFGFKIKTVNKTGWLVIILTAVSSIAFWIYII